MNTSPESSREKKAGKEPKAVDETKSAQRVYPDAEEDLAILNESVQFRRALKLLPDVKAQVGLLLNPLGESEIGGNRTPLNFSKKCNQVYKPYSRLIAALEKAAEKKLPPSVTTLPPVFKLALISPNVETFFRYLPDVRREVFSGNNASKGVKQLTRQALEEKVWGIPGVPALEVKGLCDEYESTCGKSANPSRLIDSASVAYVKVQGVVNLKILMTAAMSKLDSLNPESVWSTLGLQQTSAKDAAQKYVHAVKDFVSQEHHPLISHLAEILWNRAYLGKDEERTAQLALTRPSVVGSALEASVINRLGPDAYRELKNDIQIYLNPKSRQRQSSAKRLLSALNFEKNDPAGHFLKTLMKNFESGHSPREALRSACSAASSVCGLDAVASLLKVESILRTPPRPKPYQIDARPEYHAREILNSFLTEYGRIAVGNLLWKTASSPYSFPIPGEKPLSVSQLDSLAYTSTVLAGIPNQELRALATRRP